MVDFKKHLTELTKQLPGSYWSCVENQYTADYSGKAKTERTFYNCLVDFQEVFDNIDQPVGCIGVMWSAPETDKNAEGC